MKFDDDDDDDDVDDADDDDGYGDEAVGADSDGNSGAAAGISINAEYGNIISTMHYNYDTTMQAMFFIYRSDPTMQRHLYKDKPQLGPSRAKVNATRPRQL